MGTARVLLPGSCRPPRAHTDIVLAQSQAPARSRHALSPHLLTLSRVQDFIPTGQLAGDKVLWLRL